MSKPSSANLQPVQQNRPQQAPIKLNPAAPTYQPLAPSPLHEGRTAPTFSFTPPTPKSQSPAQTSTATMPQIASLTSTPSNFSFAPTASSFTSLASTAPAAEMQPKFSKELAKPNESATNPFNQQASPQSPKLNVLSTIPRIASKIFVDAIHPFCAAASKSAILEEEQIRRHKEEQYRHSRKENMLDSISGTMYSILLRGQIDQELATVYADERYRRGVEAKVFRFWRWRAKASHARRLERERHRSMFRTNAKDMSLGASLLGRRSSSYSDEGRKISERSFDNRDWDLALAKSVKEVSLTSSFIRNW